MEKPPDRGAVDVDAALGQFETQFVQGHFAMESNALADPFPMRRKFTARRMTLSGGAKRTRGTVQDHHVVDEPGRNPEMPGGFPVAIAFIHKRNDTLTQLHRMRLAHGASPSMRTVNHRSSKTGILNPVCRDTL